MPINSKTKEQKSAEAEVEEFHEHLGPFVVAAETTRMPMIFTDAKAPDNPIIFANDSFLRLTGYAREEVLGRSFSFLVIDESESEDLAQMKAAFDDRSESGAEIRCYRKDRSMFWVSIFVHSVLDAEEKIVQYFASFRDITGHKQEMVYLNFLLDELNHRTQNTLSTVLAIASQTLRGVLDPHIIETFEARIMALSSAHSLLGRKDWDWVSLHDVINQILRPFGSEDKRANRFLIKGEDVVLHPKAALTLAMVFHELTTNAVKYGALSTAAGQIEIIWTIEPTSQCSQMNLQWQESGGPPVTLPFRKGFGSRLIKQGLSQELGGEVSLDYEPEGVVCKINMPIPEEVFHDK